MNRVSPIIPRAVFLLVLTLAAWGDARAQEQTYTLALREVALSDAIERFVDATGLAVSYEPGLVRGRTASCAAEDVAAEAVLACILRESGIDFYRLSSGTYVLTESAEMAPERGFLAGRVTDDETGGPLAGAHVRLADAGLGAVTDRSGRFVLPALLPGSYVLSVSHLGYRSWTDSLVIRPREQVRAEASLRPEPIFITPVVVDGMQGRRSSASLGRPAVETSVAPVGGAADPASYRSLRALSGVRLNDVTADAHVQGGNPGAHQLRLDDVPVFLPRSMAGLVGPFGSFALERITVHQAGYGAPHGSQLSGVLQAEHALSSDNDFDVQADPYSVNARLRFAPETRTGPAVAAMAAGRVGLWGVLTPSRLASTLNGWSRPDPFLVLGPLDDADHTYGDPSSLLDAPVNPTLHFSDLHAAARLRFGPLRSLHASVYQGRQRLSGGVLSSELGVDAENVRSELTVVDDYRWTNRLGQVRYDAVMGSRTLASIQLRASLYRLEHEYETVDSLHVLLRDSTLELTSLSTVAVADGNRVAWLALEGTVDHALDRHHVQVGAETGLIDSRFDLFSVFFPMAAFGSNEGSGSGSIAEGFVDVETNRRSVRNATDAWYAAAFAQDRIHFGENLEVEIGSRLTYVHARRTAYAEPRLSLTTGAGESPLGAWTARTSAGIYRQYVNQTDASKLNTGALIPSVRIWLPVDATVRPPMAYHLAQDLLFEPSTGWSVRVNGYAKYKPHDLALAYAPADSALSSARRVTQSEFLVSAREAAYGGHVAFAWKSTHVRAEARYGYEFAERESSALFDGRKHPSPWTEPHRIELAADWLPNDRLALSARWRSIWGRPWGFRRAYYDYFGHDDDTRTHPPFDLGDPGAHRLPPIHQIDLSAAYTRTVGAATVQVRAEVINLLNRENVLDWRLVRDDAAWRKEARTLYPMIPSLAVRVGM